MVQYRTKPERVEENQRLIEAVFADAAQAGPDGLEYAAYRLADGVSFVHILTTEAGSNPLVSSSAFNAFQAGIADRCEEGPVPGDASKMGSYPG